MAQFHLRSTLLEPFKELLEQLRLVSGDLTRQHLDIDRLLLKGQVVVALYELSLVLQKLVDLVGVEAHRSGQVGYQIEH